MSPRAKVIETEDAKGNAVAALMGHHPDKPVAFIDDLPPNHASVLKSVPGALGLHLMAYQGLRPHLPPMPEGVTSVEDWPAAAQAIAGALPNPNAAKIAVIVVPIFAPSV